MKYDLAYNRRMPSNIARILSVIGIVSAYRHMKYTTLLLCLLLSAGCSTGIIVHDEDRAAELVVDFLTGIKSAEGTRLSYEWTDEKYKEKVTPGEFLRIVSSIREKNQGADIRLDGYGRFGPAETIIVYASSDARKDRMYFKFTLTGTKSRDYYLLQLDIADSNFDKQGIYKEYRKSILVQGV